MRDRDRGRRIGVDVDARIQALLAASPDLATDFATRVNVLRVSPHEWYLVVTSNHLVMDAATIFIVGVQLLQAMCGTTAPLVDSDAPYRDFVATQRALDATTLTAARAFFVERIIDGDGVPVSVDLPVDRVRTEQGAKTGGTVRVPVSRRLPTSSTRCRADGARPCILPRGCCCSRDTRTRIA